MPQLPQHTQRKHWLANNLRGQRPQLKRRPSQPTELLAKRSFCEWMLTSLLTGLLRRQIARQASFGRGRDLQHLAGACLNLEIERRPPQRIGAGERLAQ